MTFSMKTPLLFLLAMLVYTIPPALGDASSGPLKGTVLKVMPNGLRMIVREQHSTPLVAIDVWVRAGSGREQAGESGAAHFLEHLIFKGTTTRKPGEIDGAIEDLGASLGATTIRDGAHFFTTIATPYVADALAVLSDAMQNAVLAPEEMERERAVILDEMAHGRNDTNKRVLNALFERLCNGHPYENPILGQVESLRNLKRDTVAAFYHRWYVPNNVTLVIVGDITPDAAQEAVQKSFGSWAKHELPIVNKIPSTENVSPPAELVGQSKALHYALGMGFRVMAGDSATPLSTAAVTAVLLADGENSRLWSAVKARQAELSDGLPKRPLARREGSNDRREMARTDARSLHVVSIAADCAPLAAAGVFSVVSVVDGGKPDATIRLFTDELHRLQKEPVSADEIEAARRQVISSYLYNIETFGGQARMLGFYDVVQDYRFAVDFVETTKRVMPSDVLAFAQRYFDPAHRVDLLFPLQ